MPDHVHMLTSIPPKYAVSQVIGFIKGKSAIHLACTYGERKIYAQFEQWRQRPLQGRFVYVYLDGVWLKRSWGG